MLHAVCPIQTRAQARHQPASGKRLRSLQPLLHDHLRSDYVKQQENGATYPFSYTLHPQTQQWQKQYAQEAQALLHNAPEARGLLKQSLQTFPFAIIFPSMAL